MACKAVGNRLLRRILLSGDMGGKFFIFAVAAFCCLFAPAGCGKGGRQAPENLPVEQFRDGDLAFRRGMGLTSRAVLAADRRGAYSHVGILKQLDGTWCVIHAVPGESDTRSGEERVKVDALDVFFARSRAASGAVMRVEAAQEQACRAAQRALALYQAGVLFDHAYDLSDTVRMYCTELVEHVYKREGIDLSEGRRSRVDIPLFDGEYLLPHDIAQNEGLRVIYEF